jgi:uncharacterized protein YjdB
MSVWADGVWAPGVWAAGVWAEDSPEAPVVAITGAATKSVIIGRTRQLTVALDGSPTPTLVWSSDDELIATVDEDTGLVTGVALGSAIITVEATSTEGSDQDTVTINVVEGGSTAPFLLLLR